MTISAETAATIRRYAGSSVFADAILAAIAQGGGGGGGDIPGWADTDNTVGGEGALAEQTFNDGHGYNTAFGARALANATAASDSNTAFGTDSGRNLTTEKFNVIIGDSSSVEGGDANVVVGAFAGANGTRNTVVGEGAQITATDDGGAIAIGHQSNAFDRAVSIGEGAQSSAQGVAVGRNASSVGGATVVGYGALGTSNSTVVGNSSNDNGHDACTVIGSGADSGAGGAIVIGDSASDFGANTVQLGGSGTVAGRVGAPVALAGLPDPTTCAGARAMVTDATVAFSGTVLGTAITGGGGDFTPAYSDGVNWLYG